MKTSPKSQTLAVLVSIGFAASCFAANKPAPSPRHLSPNEQMKKAAIESQKGNVACAKFDKQAQALLGKEDPKKGWPWGSKTEELLKLVEAYPGTPVQSREGWKLLRETPNPQKAFHLENVASLYSCPMMDYYHVTRKLIASLNTAPQGKRDAAVQAILGQARREFSGPASLMPILIEGNIVKQLTVSGMAPTMTAKKAAVEKTLKDSNAVKAQLVQQSKGMSRKNDLTVWAREGVASKKMGDQWLALLPSAPVKAKAKR